MLDNEYLRMKTYLSVLITAVFLCPAWGQDEVTLPEKPETEAAAGQEAPVIEEQGTEDTDEAGERMQKQMTQLLSGLVSDLASVRDATSAAEVAADVERVLNELYSIDASRDESVDEEELAAGMRDLFYDLEQQVSRLYEVDFYGNEALQRAFGAADAEVTPPPGKDDAEPEEDDAE